ncbi:MAG: 2-amino-4-hydroxy-6-hydroxymethyldihydropteridine diphosphokinase [Actinomycetota bacterium]
MAAGPPSGVDAFLGLGANLGDRLATLQAAADRIGATDGIELLGSSRVYETVPVGGPEQPDYLNAVVRVRTSLEPHTLLDALHGIEAALGRERTVRWGPRTIDIDILTYGDAAIDDPDLEVPHPRMHERAFVLVPLLELIADPRLPGGRRVRDLRGVSPDVPEVRPVAPPLVVRR